MSDELGEAMALGLEGSRLELALEFRRTADGTKSGAVVIRDGTGATIATIPVESPEAMNVAVARLVQLGFRDPGTTTTKRPRPTAPRAARVRAGVLVAGVDGYRKGWVAVSLDPSGDVQVSTHSSFAEVLSLQARVIAVDMPIDPQGLGTRAADAAARAFVGGRASSVFPPPPRAALQARTFAEASEIARTITGKGISQQSFALARKILEVHDLAEVDERVIEMHPEVSFCRLAEEALADSKHTPAGLERRRALLASAGLVLPGAVAGVPEADLLDAAAGAWTAVRYSRGEADPFPPEHRDRLGAIWA
jgi:predicted RNase H-like nuclease